MTSTVQQIVNSFADSLLPPPALLVSEWARENFRLSSEYSAIVGSFQPHPYQIEPLDVLSPTNPADVCCLMCSAQMMKTLIMLVFLGYVIDVDPGPVLIVQPSEADADSFSKERIAPLFRDVPAIAQKVVEAKSRDTGNTILQKRFHGGQVTLTGAISPTGLRRRSIRYLLCDEIDGYEETSEGDPIALARMRTLTFWNRKIVLCSTPTDEGKSRIAEAYAESDQRQFFVPCPMCGHEQVLMWAGVRWGNVDGTVIEPINAHYQCAECKGLIPDHRKIEMLRQGRWIAQNPAGRYPGFHINRLYAPDWPWGRVVVEEFLPAQAKGNLRVFVNTILAETWKEKAGEAPDWEKLMSRREEYRLGKVPDGVLFLTAGVDVQKTWVEGYVWGWGRNGERWVVDQFRVESSPYEARTWDQLTQLLNVAYQHSSGTDLLIAKLAIDSGHATQEVYAWARQQGSRVISVDGRATGSSILGQPAPVDVTVSGRKIKSGVKIWPVNVSMAKSEIYGLLSKDRPAEDEPWPHGWVHFSKDLNAEFFKQLTAEQLVTRIVKGYRKDEWQKTRDRNEALDCAIYARAAAVAIGVNRFKEQQWAEFESYLGTPRAVAAQVKAQTAPIPAKPVVPSEKPQQSGGGWLGETGGWFSR